MGAAMPLPAGPAMALNRPAVRIIGKRMPRIAPVRALPSGIFRVCRPPAAPRQDPGLVSNPDQASGQAAKGWLQAVAPPKRIRLQRLQRLACLIREISHGGCGGCETPRARRRIPWSKVFGLRHSQHVIAAVHAHNLARRECAPIRSQIHGRSADRLQRGV